jgi:hypothetical protein
MPACLAASPAVAAELPVTPSPPAGTAAVPAEAAPVDQQATAATSGVAAATTAVEETVRQTPPPPPASTLRPVVEDATRAGAPTDGVVKPLVDSAVRTVASAAQPAQDGPAPTAGERSSSGTPGPAAPTHVDAPAGSDQARGGLAPAQHASGKAPAEPARRAGPAADSTGASRAATPIASRVSPVAAHGAIPGASPATSAPARDDRFPGPERPPLPVGGAVASGAGVSFFLGGFAILAIALFLASPPVRRRLLIRPAMCWPAAFVPLLERPG